jgi:hypothetical protein
MAALTCFGHVFVLTVGVMYGLFVLGHPEPEAKDLLFPNDRANFAGTKTKSFVRLLTISGLSLRFF